MSVTTRAGEVFSGATCVVAVPLNTWRDIEFAPGLSERKRQAASEGHAGHSTKVWALVENAPDHLVGVGWGGGLNWLSTEFTLPEGSLMVGFGTGPEMLDVRAPTTSGVRSTASSPAPACWPPTRTTGTGTSSRAAPGWPTGRVS